MLFDTLVFSAMPDEFVANHDDIAFKCEVFLHQERDAPNFLLVSLSNIWR
jgi:hypothetical protein